MAREAVNPRIYIAELGAYVQGDLHGAHVELGGDAEENLERIKETIEQVLRTSPSPDAEEWAIHDHEGFGELRLGEHEDPETVSRVAALIVEHGPVFAALVSYLGGTGQLDEAIRYMEEQYQGAHDSLQAWAEQYLEDTGELGKVPESLRGYIDFEAWSRDAELNGDIFAIEAGGGQVHVFSN